MSAYPSSSSSRGKVGNSQHFPTNLHMFLDDAEKANHSHIISWCSQGQAFKIHDQEALVPLLSNYFRQTKFKSFLRQLQSYDFNRITRGREKGTVSHPLFIRGRRSLSDRMARKATGASISQQQSLVHLLQHHPSSFSPPRAANSSNNNNINDATAALSNMRRTTSAPIFSMNDRMQMRNALNQVPTITTSNATFQYQQEENAMMMQDQQQQQQQQQQHEQRMQLQQQQQQFSRVPLPPLLEGDHPLNMRKARSAPQMMGQGPGQFRMARRASATATMRRTAGPTATSSTACMADSIHSMMQEVEEEEEDQQHQQQGTYIPCASDRMPRRASATATMITTSADSIHSMMQEDQQQQQQQQQEGSYIPYGSDIGYSPNYVNGIQIPHEAFLMSSIKERSSVGDDGGITTNQHQHPILPTSEVLSSSSSMPSSGQRQQQQQHYEQHQRQQQPAPAPYQVEQQIQQLEQQIQQLQQQVQVRKAPQQQQQQQQEPQWMGQPEPQQEVYRQEDKEEQPPQEPQQQQQPVQVVYHHHPPNDGEVQVQVQPTKQSVPVPKQTTTGNQIEYNKLLEQYMHVCDQQKHLQQQQQQYLTAQNPPTNIVLPQSQQQQQELILPVHQGAVVVESQQKQFYQKQQQQQQQQQQYPTAQNPPTKIVLPQSQQQQQQELILPVHHGAVVVESQQKQFYHKQQHNYNDSAVAMADDNKEIDVSHSSNQFNLKLNDNSTTINHYHHQTLPILNNISTIDQLRERERATATVGGKILDTTTVTAIKTANATTRQDDGVAAVVSNSSSSVLDINLLSSSSSNVTPPQYSSTSALLASPDPSPVSTKTNIDIPQHQQLKSGLCLALATGGTDTATIDAAHHHTTNTNNSAQHQQQQQLHPHSGCAVTPIAVVSNSNSTIDMGVEDDDNNDGTIDALLLCGGGCDEWEFQPGDLGGI